MLCVIPYKQTHGITLSPIKMVFALGRVPLSPPYSRILVPTESADFASTMRRSMFDGIGGGWQVVALAEHQDPVCVCVLFTHH